MVLWEFFLRTWLLRKSLCKLNPLKAKTGDMKILFSNKRICDSKIFWFLDIVSWNEEYNFLSNLSFHLNFSHFKWDLEIYSEKFLLLVNTDLKSFLLFKCYSWIKENSLELFVTFKKIFTRNTIRIKTY